MYKFNQNAQMSLYDFNQPIGLKMNPENRWIKKAEEKWNVEIDITAIRQCLLAVKDIDHINTDKLPDDINYNPDSPVEEPQKINQNTLALIDVANKLKNHDFIVDS